LFTFEIVEIETDMKKLFIAIAVLFTFSSVNAQTLLDTAINFSVKDTEGNNIELFSILDQNKIVVIDFYSTA